MPVSDVSLHECGGYHHPSARSVSWNSTGNWLAIGARIWSIEGSSSTSTISASNSAAHNNASSTSNVVGRCSEVMVISGHNGAVERVRFSPTDPNCLCTSGAIDGTVRIFDIRAGAERAVGLVEVRSGKNANYIDWCPSSSGGGGSTSYLSVTERDGSVHVYDARKLSSSGTNNNLTRGGRSNNSGGGSSKSTPLSTFRIPKVDMDACIFSPSGNHLVAATAPHGEFMSDLRIWSWKEGSEAFQKSLEEQTLFTVPAHTGPIFSLAFSPDGKRLATGSSDSIVGIWDVATMCCTATISRRLKLIRGVAFSHDSKWLAHCNEEDGIDIASASTGEQVGMLQLRENPTAIGLYGGADEIAFNPASGHILACARAPVGHLSSASQSAAVVIKCRISSAV